MSASAALPGDPTDALVERLYMATIGTLEVASVYVGGRLGFYRALAEAGTATPADARRPHRCRGALRQRVARATGSRRIPDRR